MEEVIEALLEGRPIRSWSTPELVELEALAAGEQVCSRMMRVRARTRVQLKV